MTSRPAQSRVAASRLWALTQAQLFAVLVTGLFAFLALELLPCSGAPQHGAAHTDNSVWAAVTLPAAPATPHEPTSPPVHRPECALSHMHCSALIMSALTFGAVLALVAILRARPPLTFPTWTVAPPLPPP
jgi:hypothetical protein